MGHIEALYRYPVKGLSGESLKSVRLSAGEVFPGDRAWAVEKSVPAHDWRTPKYFPKTRYLTLMRDEGLASLRTVFDEERGVLKLTRTGGVSVEGRLAEASGRDAVESFLTDHLTLPPGSLRVVTASGFAFTDVAQKWVSLINLSSVAEAGRLLKRPVDAMRFRGNIWIGGCEPWEERDWIGRRMRIGEVEVVCREATMRCAATNVDPQTGERDMSIPSFLQRRYGEGTLGVYGEVVSEGRISAGDTIAPRGGQEGPHPTA